MSSFDARLRLPGHARIPLGVVVDISNEVMTLSSGDRQLGNWPLNKLQIRTQSDGFHLRVDDQDVVLTVTDSDQFAIELGVVDQAGRRDAIAKRLASIPPEEQFEDVTRRIDGIRALMKRDDVSPADAFHEWLRLLKEINVSHGQGSMPSPLYHRLNTQLLDVFPTPTRSSMA